MSSIEGHWLLDLGNTRLKLARIRDDRVVLQDAWPLSSHETRHEPSHESSHAPSDAGTLPSAMCALMAEDGCRDPVWLASSAGADRSLAVQQALVAAGHGCHAASTQASCGRLRIAYERPERLGVDRFLALLAASEREDGPWLIVSVGSALTLDLLDSEGQHLGGLITLSPTLQRELLAARIPHLDVAGGRASDFAVDTADALASGALASALGAIERSRRQAEARLGRVTLLLTGGGAGELQPLLAAPIVHAPQLVFDGLASYARYFACLPTR